MKKIGFAAACLFAGGIFASPALAEPVPACLQSNLIDHTQVVNSKTVLFHMRGGKIWQNNLAAACPDLKVHGFIVRGHDNEICGGQGITLIETGSVCMLGKFAPYVPAHPHGS